MAGGVTGRSTKAAYARSNTWGTAASVTRQILLLSTEGIEDMPTLVEDDAFNQTFIAAGEVGDRTAPTPELSLQMRYEAMDAWLAGACGSAAAPVVISSTAANSNVAARHVITMAPEITHFWTLAVDAVRYVKELTTFKVRGFTISVGDNGRLQLALPTVGSRVKYDSAVNINSTVGGAVTAEVAHRIFRKDGRFRMNLASAGSLVAADQIDILKDFTLTYQRPLAGEDHVVGSDTIIEPDDDGFAEATLAVTYPRMTTVAANSLAIAFGLGQEFKADFFFQGAYINSETRRSLLIEMPSLQVSDYKASFTGANQVRPQITFKLHRATSAPTGMAGITNLMQLTLINARSTNLLT